MAAPVYVPGQVLTSQDCDVWFTGLYAYKTGDTSIASSTTPMNDPHLVLALASSSVYEVRYSLFYANASASAIGFNWSFTIPASTSGEHNKWYWTTSSVLTVQPDLWTTSRTGFIDNTRDWGASGEGVIITGASSGNLTLQWSQNVSNATATILRKHSLLTATRIA